MGERVAREEFCQTQRAAVLLHGPAGERPVLSFLGILSSGNLRKAAVVAEAYDFTPDWSEVLYQQVILKGDFNYLEEYKQHGLLKASTFEEVAQKFKQQAASESAVRSLKRLLTYCEDIYVYYKLAYDNQFYDVVKMLLNDAQTGCCLNDLLAN